MGRTREGWLVGPGARWGIQAVCQVSRGTTAQVAVERWAMCTKWLTAERYLVGSSELGHSQNDDGCRGAASTQVGTSGAINGKGVNGILFGMRRACARVVLWSRYLKYLTVGSSQAGRYFPYPHHAPFSMYLEYSTVLGTSLEISSYWTKTTVAHQPPLSSTISEPAFCSSA